MASAEPGRAVPAARTGAEAAARTGAEAAAGAGTWLELAVTADLEAVEAVSEILSRHAPGGTSVEPGFRLVDEGLGAEVDTARPATVRAYLPGGDRAAARAAIEAIGRDLGHLQAFGLRAIGELAVEVVHESDWAEAWKEHFPVLRLGRRLVVRPTWRDLAPAPDEVVLSLDPGMAFGTGLHPTTRLCLVGIERWADAGLIGPATRVLDVGCGSGILAIAAALLGAGEVAGVDPDPIAIEATTANATLNGVERRVRARQGSLPSGAGPFGLVAANLIASLLIALAPQLRAELRAGGRLIASGIFVDREAEVGAALQAAGFSLGARWGEGDWVALEAVA